MALDIYVGTLTRYYSGAWENVIQGAARDANVPYVKLAPNAADPPPDDEIRSAVLRWRDELREAWRSRVRAPSDWSEDDAQPYYSDRPGWDGLQSLRVLALCVDAGTRPPRKPPADCTAHPLWNQGRIEASAFAALFVEDLWLPWDFEFSERAKSPTGSTIEIGSAFALQRQLHELNRATYRADGTTLERWRKGLQPNLLVRTFGDSFAPQAQYGLALMIEAADRAVEDRLPMRTDY